MANEKINQPELVDEDFFDMDLTEAQGAVNELYGYTFDSLFIRAKDYFKIGGLYAFKLFPTDLECRKIHPKIHFLPVKQAWISDPVFVHTDDQGNEKPQRKLHTCPSTWKMPAKLTNYLNEVLTDQEGYLGGPEVSENVQTFRELYTNDNPMYKGWGMIKSEKKGVRGW